MAITLTKVRLPQRGKEVLRRIRLIDALHQTLHRKLTFMSAPAGYGKTTLLVDFASDVDAVVCWYTIGAEDVDLVPFVQHMVASFQQKFPQFGKEFDDLLSSASGSPDPGSMAAELTNEIVTQIDDFCIFILDDYHIVGENQAIVDFVEALLEHLPDQVRMFIGSRSVYGIPTANLYVREDLALLNDDDLRFRAEELQKLVDRNFHLKLSEEESAMLAERADGWIVAILLAVRTMEHGGLPKFEGAKQNIYEFLANDVVSKQPPPLQDFLLATSVVDEYTEPLANHLLDESSTIATIRELEARNLFLTRVETDDETTYRYHQLFVDFLRDRLAEVDLDRMQKLHQRAAEWYRERQQWELAVRHKLAAGDREEAAEWMDQAANQLFVAGHESLLAQWYQTLTEPVDLRERAPRLMLNQAKAHFNPSAVEEVESLLDIAEGGLKRGSDVPERANLLITRGMVRSFQSNYDEAMEMADAALKLLKGEKKTNQVKYRQHQANRLKGYCYHYLGQSDKAIAYLNKAVVGFQSLVDSKDRSQSLRSSHDLAETYNDLGLVCLENGQVFEGQQAFQKALEIRRQQRSNRGALAIALNNVAYLHHQVGHYRQAWLAYEQGLEAAKSANWRRAVINILNGKADILADLEEWETARDLYLTAQRISEEDKEYGLLYRTYQKLANLERLRGRYNEALNYLRESGLGEEDAPKSPTYKVNLGAIYLSMGQYDLARQEFQQAFQTWGEVTRPTQEQILTSFLLGQTLYHSDREKEALEHLFRALRWSAQLGYDQFLVVAARQARPFLEHAKKGNSNPQLQSLLQRARDFETGTGQLQIQSAPEDVPDVHLEIRALGSGQVRLNGELIPNSEWRATGARALFFYIVDRGSIRKEDVAQEFWPDFSPAKVSSNFHSSLWRVRQALGGKEMVTFKNNRYRLHPSIDLWYDVSEFERLLEQANSDQSEDSERIEMWRRAVELYQGEFLPDIYMDWAERRGKELQELYLAALTDLAYCELERNHYPDANILFEKVLSIDPYRDLVHLGLMKSLAKSKSPTAAKAHYKSYKEMLWKELQTDPMPELQSYYEQLA